jgi:hypothetical protein
VINTVSAKRTALPTCRKRSKRWITAGNKEASGILPDINSTNECVAALNQPNITHYQPSQTRKGWLKTGNKRPLTMQKRHITEAAKTCQIVHLYKHK